MKNDPSFFQSTAFRELIHAIERQYGKIESITVCGCHDELSPEFELVNDQEFDDIFRQWQEETAEKKKRKKKDKEKDKKKKKK